ncbi:MAG: hypothetical protein FWD80_00080, partial [Propionibacteriaceae bacterium]|nr:hypothetical protein [Propionibacteriaceae bacterium]
DTSKFGVPVQAGNPIGYTVEVSNSGNVTLTNVTVNDPLLGGDITSKCNWPAGSVGKLVPSQKVSCDVSYPLTQTDIDKGKVLNTATATGYGPDGTKVTGDGSVTTDLTKTTGYGPGLKTVKTADKSGLSDPVQVNDPIVYTVKSTNTGDLTLTGVTVSDKLANGHVVALSCTWPGVAGTLLPGQTVTCTGTYLLTQPDIDAGEVTNTGHAEGTPPSTPDNPNPTPIPGDDTIITNVPSDPSISLTKTGSLTTSPAKAGDTVRFGFEATNDGNVTLTNVSVADKLAGVSSITYTWPDSSKPGVLAPGQTVTGVATYKLTQTDVDAGHVANTATVTGTPPNGPNVTGDGDTDVKIPAAGGLSVKKIALGADDSTITELVEGNTIDYSFVVTNTGNVTISGVSINDTDFTGTGTMSSIICPSTALAPGKSAICTATYVITQDDVDAGTLSNTATATGTPPDPDQPPVDSPPDTIIVPGDMEPGLQVVKSYDISGFSSPVFAGDPIDYTVDVTNSGNVTLTDVTVVDPLLGGDITGDCVWPDTQGKLNPGQQASCEMAYPLTQADVDKGKVLNTATATGHDSDGTEVSDEDSVTTDLTVTPGYGPDLTVAKNDDTSGLSSPAEIDDPIVYTVTAANTGDLTLTGVTVTDELLGGDITASCTWPGKAGVLLPKQVVTCGGTYLVTQVDIDAGKVSNTALAHGTPPSTPDNPNPTPIPGDDTIITNVPSDPSISLTKTGSLTTSPAKAGDTVKFSFEAANDGNVTLTNVSVADKLAGVSSITYTWPDSSKPGVLAPGESVTGEATYKLTQANVDAGHVANTATATGTPPDGPNVTGDGDTDVKIPAAGGLSMKKIASGEDGNPVSKLVAGDTINYSFVVTNSGNVTISSVSINDTDFTGTGTITGIVCPSTALAPGKSMTCTASYVITQDDVDAGTLSNTATATGTPPDPDQPPVDSPPDTVTVPSDPEPSLSLNKTGALAAGATGVAGDIVEYAFTATNTGNTTLENVSISDQMVGLSNITYTWPSAEGVLTPGQQVTATATYTLTQKDVDAGGVHNLAIVTDTTPPDDGCTDQTTCGSDSTDVPVTAHPALDLVKTDSVNGGPATDLVVGQVIDYKFKVTNTGNVTMSNINIVEQTFTGSGLMSGITCPANTLAPGGSMYCTATYKVRQADVDAGQVKNTAVAVGTPPALQTDPSTGNLVLGNCPTCTVTVQKPMTSNQSTAIAFMDPDSGLSMVKTANVSTYTAGTVITYTFTVTNTGDVSLSGVSVVEGVFNGSGRLSNVTCPATATLAPGQVLVCTATYTATAADVANGKLSNAATATGVPPTNDVTPPSKTQSPPSTVTIVAKPVVVQTGGTLAASAGAALPLGLVIAGLLTFVASLLFTTKAGEGRRYMRRR